MSLLRGWEMPPHDGMLGNAKGSKLLLFTCSPQPRAEQGSPGEPNPAPSPAPKPRGADGSPPPRSPRADPGYYQEYGADWSHAAKQHHVSRDMIISQWLKSRSPAWEEGGGQRGGGAGGKTVILIL